MPLKKRMIAIKKNPRALGTQYEGPERRSGAERRARVRRANSEDYTRVVVLGRRTGSMGPREVSELLESPGWSGKRNRALGSRLADAITHERIPISQHNEDGLVRQTTRRRMTTRRLGGDRRQPKNWDIIDIEETARFREDAETNIRKRKRAHRPQVTEDFD